MKRLIIALFCLPQLLLAQTGSIEGRIYDEINNEPIIGANIILKGTDAGASSDLDGNYKIEGLMPGLYNVEVSYIGYETQTRFEVQVSNAKSVRLDVAMVQAAQQIDSVVIKANPFERKLESPVSLTSIGVNEIQRNPGGNRDISRAIKNLPGVSSGFGFRNDLIVRGGSPNENRFYLDDIEIPVINHFSTQGASGGSNGLLNVDFINNADFYTGAFPADRGNALSSVLQLTQREGRSDRLGFTFTLGASETGLTLEGPFTKKKKTTFLLNARYSYLQWLFKALKLPFLPTYADVQYKVVHKFNNKHDLTFLGVGAFDKLRLNLSQNETDVQKYLLRNLPYQNQYNYTVGLRYRYFMENSYIIITGSRNELNNKIYKDYGNDAAKGRVYDLNADEAENKLRFEQVFRLKQYKFNYGVNYEFAQYRNNTLNNVAIGDSVYTLNYDTRLNLQKYGFFTQLSRSFVNDRLSLSLGVRADGTNYNKKMANLFRQLSPRFSASYAFTDYLSLNFNTGLYYQLPPYTTLGYRDNSGNAVNKEQLDYIRNFQVVGGLSSTINSSNTKFSLEGFYKLYSHYPMLLDKGISLANLGGDYGWVGDEPAAASSKGKTYGLEFSVQQKLWKGVYGILSYTWFRSLFTDISGSYHSSSWDSRHVASITAGYKFRHNWEIGIKWSIQGGLPYTPYDTTNLSLISVWNASNGSPLKDYSKLNALRTKVLHGMNVRVDKKWFLKKININIYLDITNIYNAKDVTPDYIDVQRDANDNPVVDPNDSSRYLLKSLKANGSSILPTLGLVLEL